MNKQTISLVRGVIAIFWLGFFMAISFLEAPLKFTASNLSLAEGLRIGKIVFGALNKCEWVFLLLILGTCFIKKASKRGCYLIAIMGAVLLIETVWLLPVLDAGANKIISGQPSNDEVTHWLYVMMEIIKVPVLLMIGWDSIRNKVALDPGKVKDTSLSNI